MTRPAGTLTAMLLRESSALHVLRRRPEHDEELFALYGGVFGTAQLERSRFRWRWQYIDNPNTGPDGPVIWIAEQGDRLLGQMATMPVRLWWRDREVVASIGMDCFVVQEARGRGVGIAMSSAWAASVEVALALGLTTSSYPLFKKIFTDVGPVPAFLKPLDVSAGVRQRWGPVVGAMAAPLVSFGLSVFSRSRPGVGSGFDTRQLGHFGEDFDDLWIRVRRSYSSIVCRDAAYLNWKYLRCPFRVYRVIEARRRGELSGFVVLRDEGSQALRRGVIVDLFCDPLDVAVQDALLAAGVDDFRSNRVASVEAYCFDTRLAAALQRHGFRPGPTDTQYCVSARELELTATLRPTDWSLMLGDGDLDRH